MPSQHRSSQGMTGRLGFPLARYNFTTYHFFLLKLLVKWIVQSSLDKENSKGYLHNLYCEVILMYPLHQGSGGYPIVSMGLGYLRDARIYMLGTLPMYFEPFMLSPFPSSTCGLWVVLRREIRPSGQAQKSKASAKQEASAARKSGENEGANWKVFSTTTSVDKKTKRCPPPKKKEKHQREIAKN